MMLGTATNNWRALGLIVFYACIAPRTPLAAANCSRSELSRLRRSRTLLGIPHFWNVISNIPFIGIGAVGLWQFGRSQATMLLFLGIFLTGFGSAYYHLEPSDQTLFWDRLPMAVGFMAIFTTAIEERVDRRLGTILLWPMAAIGVFSLLLWRWTGDLRLYAWVQFFPCIALPLIFFLFAPMVSGTIYWLIAAMLYALAKLFEFYDSAIFSAGTILSGHTLKHFSAAAACGVLLRYFQKRKPITIPNAASCPQELRSHGLGSQFSQGDFIHRHRRQDIPRMRA
jgi:Ceramidase